MSKAAKTIRSQVRNVVQELLETEMVKSLEERVLKVVLERLNARMDLIANNAKDTLEKIDQRARDTQSLILRNSK